MTNAELKFQVFIVETVADSLFNGDKTKSFRALNDSGLLSFYLETYQTSHTLPANYILDEIKEKLNIKGDDIVKLYHGGISEIQSVDLLIGRSDIDFGKGFYLTSIYEQAVRWAMRRARFFDKKPIVNTYEFNEVNDSLKILQFNDYSEEWLDFVIANRTNKLNKDPIEFDVIIGSVADDFVVNAIDNYIMQLQENRATKNTKLALLDELKFATPNNQFCFKTTKSLKCLRFIKSEGVE